MGSKTDEGGEETVEQPIGFLNSQDDHLIAGSSTVDSTPTFLDRNLCDFGKYYYKFLPLQG